MLEYTGIIVDLVTRLTSIPFNDYEFFRHKEIFRPVWMRGHLTLTWVDERTLPIHGIKTVCHVSWRINLSFNPCCEGSTVLLTFYFSWPLAYNTYFIWYTFIIPSTLYQCCSATNLKIMVYFVNNLFDIAARMTVIYNPWK